jgi:hypothetical protein
MESAVFSLNSLSLSLDGAKLEGFMQGIAGFCWASRIMTHDLVVEMLDPLAEMHRQSEKYSRELFRVLPSMRPK